MSFQAFFDAYIECALWSSTDNSDDSGGEPLDRNYSRDDIAPESLARMEAECRDFYDAHWETWWDEYRWDDVQAGHDFWLTRNRHGAGFWDRYYDDAGRAVGAELTMSAHAYGECDLYIGDDGTVHVL